MPKQTALEEALQRLERWSAEKLPESAIEGVILLDLFRDALGFDQNSAKRQQQVYGKKSGRTDTVLRLARRKFVIVEVKRIGLLTDGAIKQAARYVRDMGQQFGIVTDGVNWVYFKVVPFGKSHRVHRLVKFNVKENPKVALRVFRRSRRGTIRHFLNLLSAIHQAMSQQEFAGLMNKGLNSRVRDLVAKAKGSGVEAVSEDESVLRLLYAGITPTQLIQPILEPLKLTRKS